MVEASKDKNSYTVLPGASYRADRRQKDTLTLWSVSWSVLLRTYVPRSILRIYPECVSDPEPIVVRDMKDYYCTSVHSRRRGYVQRYLLTHQVDLFPSTRDYVRISTVWRSKRRCTTHGGFKYRFTAAAADILVSCFER